MNCQRARDVFPELLDSRTAATAQLEARTHLASCPDCQREFAALTQTATALDAMITPPPSPRLRQNFYAMLEEEKHSAASVRAVTEREFQQRARRASIWRWIFAPLAACALLALGFAVGQRTPSASSTSADNTVKQQVAALQSTITRQGDQIAVQNEQIGKMTNLLGYHILQQQRNPANERLEGILAKAKDATPTDKDIDTLIQAVTLDPSANVRLRAIEALYPHAAREVVRAGLVAALSREQNPLVQLDLIDFLAAVQDRNAAPAFEKLATDASTNESVRNAAKLALAQF